MLPLNFPLLPLWVKPVAVLNPITFRGAELPAHIHCLHQSYHWHWWWHPKRECIASVCILRIDFFWIVVTRVLTVNTICFHLRCHGDYSLLRLYFSIIPFLSSSLRLRKYAFHPGQNLVCQCQKRAISDFGFSSYLRLILHWAQGYSFSIFMQ